MFSRGIIFKNLRVILKSSWVRCWLVIKSNFYLRKCEKECLFVLGVSENVFWGDFKKIIGE